MHKSISGVLLGAVLVIAAAAFAPAPVLAQCSWGCTCMGDACGCNSNGNGGRCDAGGSGCVVTRCGTAVTFYFAPDGAVVRLAVAEAAAGDAEPEGTVVPDPDLGGTTRWEAASSGRSLARHCSGVVLARYYAREEAAAIREASRMLTL